MAILITLSEKPMSGHQINKKISEIYGIYIGRSISSKILKLLMKEGCINSRSIFDGYKFRKVYSIAIEGKAILNFAKNSLYQPCLQE